MTKPLHLFLIAGEPSGDLLGAAMLKGLHQLCGDGLKIEGVGGPGMAEEGLSSRFPMEELSVMGAAEVLPRAPNLLRRIAQTADAVVAAGPDALITIDSPDFCLRVAKRARRSLPDLKVIHYVAPSVWAWRPGRARKMARYVDHVLALLPFEPSYMTAAGMTCDFVGHPVSETRLATAEEVSALRQELGPAPEGKIVLVLPGSRRGEVSRLGPVFAEAIGKMHAEDPECEFLIPAAGPVVDLVQSVFSTDTSAKIHILKPGNFPQSEVEARKRAAFAMADVALAASGTVSLELAASGTPMVIAYRLNALTAAIAKLLIRIDTVTLVNLVSGTRIVPEFLQKDCTADQIVPALSKLLRDEAAANEQRDISVQVMQALGRGGEAPGLRAARSVLRVLDR